MSFCGFYKTYCIIFTLLLFSIPPIKCFDSSLALGRDAFALEYLEDGEEENLHVKEEGEVIHMMHRKKRTLLCPRDKKNVTIR